MSTVLYSKDLLALLKSVEVLLKAGRCFISYSVPQLHRSFVCACACGCVCMCAFFFFWGGGQHCVLYCPAD